MKFNLKYFLSINFKLTEYFRTANNGNHDMLSIAVAVNFVLMLLLAATISIPVFYFNHLYAYLVLAIPALLSCTVLIACAVYFRNVKVLSVGISCILFLMINAGIYFSKGDVTVITVLWTSSIVIFTFLTISNTLGVVVLALQCAIILLYNKFPFLLNAFPNVKPLVYETTVYTVALPVFIIFYFLNRFKKSNVLLRNNLMQSVQVQQQLNATLADQFQVVQQTQQKLIESENQLRLIIETSKDIIFILDKNLTVKFASTAFADILKYDNSPDVPVKYMDVIYENDRVKVAERIGNLGNSCSADIRYTHRLQSKSGRVVWVDTILHNICDAHGEPVELLSISRDITQQKKNEDSIRLFSNLISEAEDAIVITDKAASILFVNNEAALMFGFTSNEMLNLKFYDIDQYVNDDQKWERYLSEAIDNGKLLEEQNFLLASGKCIPVERKSQYSEIDGTGYVIIIIDDISDRKIQESKLRRDVEKQQILSDIAFLLNTSSDFEFKTREAVRIIGNYLQLSRISIFQDILNGKAVSNTIEWCNKGIETQRLNLQAIPYSMFPEWKDKLINDNIIEISGIFNAGSEIASAFKPFEFSSLLIFPLLLENGFTGFICFVENKKTRIWKESEKSFLSTFTQIITNAFEQKQLIDALRKSEKRFREFAELLPEMVFETNINGKITFVNRQAQLRFGIGADEMLKGLIFFNLFAERDKLKAWDNFEKRIRGTSIDNEEYSLIARDNTEIPVLLYFNLIMRDNMAIGIRAVLTDISERKVIEQQNQSLAKLPEESPYPILRMEADGNVSYSNKKGADIRHFIISNFDIYFKPLFDEIASSKQTEEIEVLIDDVFYSLAIVPVPQHNYINIYAKDITQKKRDEEKLMLSEQRFRDVAGAAGEFIWETNETFFITYVSDKVREVLGYEPFELLEKNIGVLVPQKERKTLIQTLQTFAQNGQSIVNEELVAVSKQGKLKWLTSSGIPIFDASKNFIGFRGTGMDINNRKRYEKELYNAKHEAEKASAIKAEFLSTMSHEIRTPMNAVIGLTHILLQDETRPDQLETLNTLKFSAENLLVLLNDILDFSKIESGKISFEDIDFNLHYLINSTRNAFRPLADEKGIDIKVSLPENLKYLKGDPVRLAQILNNLVSNAVKFTESGAVSINVETSAIVAEHIDLFVAISDTGIGIESDQLERIFESFTQASSDISRKFGGTGLGLAISRRLVEMMGGRLEVESVVGKGSKFSFYLRFAMGKTIHESSADSLFSEKFDSLQGLRVLIVEDNLINQVVARKFLEKWDVAFGIADDGEKALAMLENETFDLVLMDIQMPVLDGYETTRRIRKSEKPATANVPVIALTASVLLDVQTKIATAGMNDFLIKPYNPNELYSIIRKYTKH